MNNLTSPSYPPGLYCVIDEFLATYSDGSEFITNTDSDEYDIVRDNIENISSDKEEYCEILGARHYQNISEADYCRDNYYKEIHIYASILQEPESGVD